MNAEQLCALVRHVDKALRDYPCEEAEPSGKAGQCLNRKHSVDCVGECAPDLEDLVDGMEPWEVALKEAVDGDPLLGEYVEVQKDPILETLVFYTADTIAKE